MATDTKMTKTIGEHWVCAELARRDWAPALTRDGIARTDILAVQVVGERRLVEIQVKATRNDGKIPTWMLGAKGALLPEHDREFFIFVLAGNDPSSAIRGFVVPRLHVSAATHISHQNWLTEPGIRVGQRNVGPEQTRVQLPVFAGYENRWDLLGRSADLAPVLLPAVYRTYGLEERVGLPDGHPWALNGLPEW
jgi:hypothetical protein